MVRLKTIGAVSCAAIMALAGGVWARQTSPATQPGETVPTPAIPPRKRGVPPPKPAPAPQSVPAQPAPAPATPATPTSPAQQPSPATRPAQPVVQPTQKREAPTKGPYLEVSQERDYTLTATILVKSDNPDMKQEFVDPFSGKTEQMPLVKPFEFSALGFVFPMVTSTASSELVESEYRGVLKLNGEEVDRDREILKGYPGGTYLARWDAGKAGTTTVCRQVQLDLSAPMRCGQTTLHEAEAMKVPWPKGPWPEAAVSTLKPQLYIETGVDGTGHVLPYDNKLVDNAVKQWLREANIRDAAKAPPVMVAKAIAGGMWRDVQPFGEGLDFARTGELAGINLLPPAETLRLKRGSEHDITVLLAAAYKKAGLPTRTVIGYDVGKDDSKFLKKGSKENRLRSWVEFCLYDEAKNTINWVPVDVVRMRKTSTRPTGIERAWKYFGTHDELNTVAPFALHFHPPTDVVRYGAPAFWGWFVTPQAPKAAEQLIRFTATITPKRGGEPKKKEEGKKGGY